MTALVPPSVSADAIIQIPKTPQIVPDAGMDDFMHMVSPRVRFLKTAPYRSTLLDLGAGAGGMEIFRGWLSPPRQDLRMYAVSLEKGARFDAYDAYEIAN